MTIKPLAQSVPNLSYGDRRPAAILLALVLILTVVKVLYATSGYYFFADDFLNFVIARDMGMSWSYLARSAQGEFIPLFRASSWAYFHLFGLAFWPYRLLAAAHQCAVVLVAASFIPRDRPRLEFAIPVLALLAFSPVFDSSFQWFSAATNVLAESLASLIAIRFAADIAPLSFRRICLSTIFFIAAMFSFPKGLFVAAILFAVRVFAAFERDGVQPRRAVVTAARELWPVFLSGTLYVAVVVLGHYQSAVPAPTLALLLTYVWRGWNHGFLVGMFGLDQGFYGRVLLANLVVLGLIAISIIRNPKVIVLWIGFFVFFLVAIVTIALNRAVPFGLDSSEVSRYYADVTCLFIVVVIMAFYSKKASSPQNLRRGPVALVSLLTVVGIAHLLGAAARVLPVWFVPGSQVSAFVTNIFTSLQNAKAGSRIANGSVPEWVMPGWTYPLRDYDYFLLLFPMADKSVVSQNGQLRFTDEGKLVPITSNSPH